MSTSLDNSNRSMSKIIIFNFFASNCSYFKDGLKTIAHFGTYIHDLSAKLNSIKQKQDEERRKLLDLRTLLRSAPDFERVEVSHSPHPSACSMCTTYFCRIRRIWPPTKERGTRCINCKAIKIMASQNRDICSRRVRAKCDVYGRSDDAE